MQEANKTLYSSLSKYIEIEMKNHIDRTSDQIMLGISEYNVGINFGKIDVINVLYTMEANGKVYVEKVSKHRFSLRKTPPSKTELRQRRLMFMAKRFGRLTPVKDIG